MRVWAPRAALALITGCAAAATTTTTTTLSSPRAAPPVVARPAPTACERSIVADARARASELEAAATALEAGAAPGSALDDAARSRVVDRIVRALVTASTYVLADLNAQPFRDAAAAGAELARPSADPATQPARDAAAMARAATALRAGAATLAPAVETRTGFLARCTEFADWASPWPPPIAPTEREVLRARGREIADVDAHTRECQAQGNTIQNITDPGPLRACFDAIAAHPVVCRADTADRWQLRQLAAVARTFAEVHRVDGAVGTAEADVLRERVDAVLAGVSPTLAELHPADALRRAGTELAGGRDGAARLAAVRAVGDAARQLDEVCFRLASRVRQIECLAYPERCPVPPHHLLAD